MRCLTPKEIKRNIVINDGKMSLREKGKFGALLVRIYGVITLDSLGSRMKDKLHE